MGCKISWILITVVLLCSGSDSIVVKAQLLPDACAFKDFRCSDGSGCLKREKLCNGVDDCAGGEDETGNEQWECSKATLSVNCKKDQFKCSIGGCIFKEQLCDGIAQCWGGSDESIEICKNSRPRPTQFSTTRVPVSRITTTTTQRSTTSTEQANGPSTKSPQVEPSLSCPQLTQPEGTSIVCSRGNFPVACVNKGSPAGTTALYKCNAYWSPPETGSQFTRRVCQNGVWTALNTKFYCSLNCGQAGISATGFIVGGETSSVGRWPWHVGLYQQNPPGSSNYEYFCGATLISRRALLTGTGILKAIIVEGPNFSFSKAAHCVTNPHTSDVRDDKIIAVLGKYNRTFDSDDSQVQKFTLEDISVHEYYNAAVYENDIAIIWLDRKVAITERVRPVCLPQGEDNIEANMLGTLVGWGRWFDRGYPEKLQQANLPVVRVSECKATHPSLEALSRSTTYCAGYRNGTSACDGDSGGGMVFEEKRKWYIQGVVSAGIAVRAGGCDPKYYTVFTKVDKFTNWIYKLLDQKDNSKAAT